MAELIPLGPRPQQREAAAVMPQVAARQNDYLSALPQGSSELQGLVSGLATLNPRLHQMQVDQDARDQQSALDTAGAAAMKVENPVDAITGAPVTVPSTVPPALGLTYQRQFATVVAQRAAIQSRSATLTAYEQQKNTEGFSLESFMADQKDKTLGGVTDPHMVNILGGMTEQMQTELRAEDMKLRLKQHEETKNTALFTLAGQGVQPDKSVDQIAQWYHGTFVQQARDLQMDPKQAAAALLESVTAASNKGGGLPEMFKVFDSQDPEGFTILSRNPQLAAHVQAAQEHAVMQREKAIHEATAPLRFDLFTDIEKRIESDPASVTNESIRAHVNKYELSEERGAHYVAQAAKKLQEQAAWGSVMDDLRNGRLGKHDPKIQKQALEQALGPTIDLLWNGASASANEKDPAKRQQAQATLQSAITDMMQVQSRARSTVVVPALERYIEQSTTSLPSADGPSPGFKATAEIYKAMSGDPDYRARHFKGDQAEVFDQYTRAQAGGTDEKTAYAEAYKSIDPAAKEAAKKLTDSPEFTAKVLKVTKAIEGSSFLPRFLGGNGRPNNPEYMTQWGIAEAKSFAAAHPNHSEADVLEHVQQSLTKNWVVDPTSNTVVKVPAGMADSNTRDALASYSKDFLEAGKARGIVADGAEIRYEPVGTEGKLEVQAWNGASSMARTGAAYTSLGTTSVEALLQRRREQTTLSPEESKQLGAIRFALRTGDPLPIVSPQLMGKGRSLFFRGSELDQLDRAVKDQFLANLKTVPKMSFGPTSLGSISLNASKNGLDHQLTSQIASDFLAGPMSDHKSLAASLITLREGAMLRVYDDPAGGAGKNIGMGYNLKANAANADADLRRSGVPAEMLDGVKAGKAQITDEQARRLLTLSIDRYEAQTRAAAEATSPGLWDKRMTPVQKAAMIDVAWQTGSPEKFTKAWTALGNNDAAAFSAEAKTFYRKTPDGPLVEDSRGNQLRAQMVDGGVVNWKALVAASGKRPSTSLQAAALKP